jgi:hypothetical protein
MAVVIGGSQADKRWRGVKSGFGWMICEDEVVQRQHRRTDNIFRASVHLLTLASVFRRNLRVDVVVPCLWSIRMGNNWTLNSEILKCILCPAEHWIGLYRSAL